MAIGVGVAIAGAFALGLPMARYTDAVAPWIDSTLTSFSFLAQVCRAGDTEG